MIAAGNPQEFVPFGRNYCLLHPGTECIATPPRPAWSSNSNSQSTPNSNPNPNPDPGTQLLASLKEISIRDLRIEETGKFRSGLWQLNEARDTKDPSCEEELYVSGNTVVWSRGSLPNSRHVCKAYTVDYPVQQALWCNFFLAGNKPNILTKIEDTETTDGRWQPSICIIDSTNVNVFTTNGEEYMTPLPFQISKAWSVKYGLLVERAASPHGHDDSKCEAEQLPTLFSLMHPLDEFTPVISRSGPSCSGDMPKVRSVCAPHQRVVFTTSSPSLVMTYNGLSFTHSLWNLRKTTVEETILPTDQTATMAHGMTCSNLSSSQSRLTLSSQSPSQNNSPYRNYGSRVASPSLNSRSFSPGVSGITHMAALSRSQSPSISGTNMYKYSVGTTMRSPMASAKIMGNTMDNSNLSNELNRLIEPLAPDLCIELLWNELTSVPFTREMETGMASKGFMTLDFIGQKYLCYLVPSANELRFVKVDESNDGSQLIFGSMSTIGARDVANLENIKMIILVDLTWNLVLYSGTNKVCRIHVPNLHASLSHTHMGQRDFSTPRCEAIATSSRPTSALTARFDEAMNLLSPVCLPSQPVTPAIVVDTSFIEDASLSTAVTLKDPVHNRITLDFGGDVAFRVSIPALVESCLVWSCLQAVRSVLPRSLMMQLYTKWYSTTHALGSGSGSHAREWATFVSCLLGMMGYDVENLSVTRRLDADLIWSPIVPPKRFKSGDGGSDEDWQYLLNWSTCNHHQSWMKLKAASAAESDVPSTVGSINTGGALFQYIPPIFYALHLVYEELKLNILSSKDLELVLPLLVQLARDLRVDSFLDYYWRDFPSLYTCDLSTQVDDAALTTMVYPSYLTSDPPSIYQWLYDCLRGRSVQPFPYIASTSERTKNVVLLYAALTGRDVIGNVSTNKYLRRISGGGYQADLPAGVGVGSGLSCQHSDSIHEKLVVCMNQLHLRVKDLECLPPGVSLPLRNAIYQCRQDPPPNWSQEAYSLIGREDLAAQIKAVAQTPEFSIQAVVATATSTSGGDTTRKPASKDDDDGMEHLDHEVLRLRFGADQRLEEVRHLLQSSKPVRISVVQRPEVSDHDFIEEQERNLYSLCLRTMSLSVGRGMFTLRTARPIATETLPVPKLCLTGRAFPRNNTVDMSHIEIPANMSMWPLFHNGVAAGLRIKPDSLQIDSPWIVYNKPRGNNEMPMEHAGFLMALGLTGHLSTLATLNIHDYLIKGHETTSVGLLLGISAAKRGTMDPATTKLLSIHAEALLPPTSTELDIPHVVQVAAILGVGLVYEGTVHRHMAEVLLSEIGRPPGPEMENSMDRESYSLAAGLALGLVTFGCGSQAARLLDASMTDQLFRFMVGGHGRSLTGPHKEKYKSPSYQIKEGDCVNIDVTSPGATLALGMMYFRTGNGAVAEWMTPPDTQFLLDFVRPDFLLLRTLCKGLILWDEIYPSAKWVKDQIPDIVSQHAFGKDRANEDIDYETMSQAYCNIVAGACMAMGLRFAGSANDAAFSALMEFVKLFIGFSGKAAVADQAGRNTIETCLITITVSLSLVMAGSGCLDVLRICRYLRSRVGQAGSYVLYGSHMAVHMAVGLLFLGGGKYTLSTDGSGVAAMLCAFFPKFPTHSNDNRYHLQAFRHLYVLAVEPRLAVPRDIDSRKACFAHFRIRFRDTVWYQGAEYTVRAPCILPQLDMLEEVVVCDERYWPIKFHRNKNWASLRSILSNQGTLYVKQKAGCLSYTQDPKGFRSLLARSLTKDNASNWAVKPEAVEAFSSDPSVLNFTRYFLHKEASTTDQEGKLKQMLCTVLYDCVTQEKMEVFTTCILLMQALNQMSQVAAAPLMWQIKLLLATACCLETMPSRTGDGMLVSREFALAVHSCIEQNLQHWRKEFQNSIVTYLQGQTAMMPDLPILVAYLVHYDMPTPQKIASLLASGSDNVAAVCLQKLDFSTAMQLKSLFASTIAPL